MGVCMVYVFIFWVVCGILCGLCVCMWYVYGIWCVSHWYVGVVFCVYVVCVVCDVSVYQMCILWYVWYMYVFWVVCVVCGMCGICVWWRCVHVVCVWYLWYGCVLCGMCVLLKCVFCGICLPIAPTLQHPLSCLYPLTVTVPEKPYESSDEEPHPHPQEVEPAEWPRNWKSRHRVPFSPCQEFSTGHTGILPLSLHLCRISSSLQAHGHVQCRPREALRSLEAVQELPMSGTRWSHARLSIAEARAQLHPGPADLQNMTWKFQGTGW